MRRRGHSWYFPAIALLVVGQVQGTSELASAADPSISGEADARTFFEQNVRPVLESKCINCHGPEKQKGGLRLDSLEAMLQGGESGPAVVPGNLEESLLVEAIHPDGFFAMPPTGTLEPKDVDALTHWVEAGAHWPGVEATGVAPKSLSQAAKITDEDRAFWSFQPLSEPIIPEVDEREWSVNPIDRFILDRLHREGLSPAPEADRRTLIRRLSFDLTGLPPEPAAVSAFLADPSPNAYESLVDRLLGSPAYGERWGRHWLDLVRYAESDGHRQDAYRPDAWRYRDYVVESFNSDKPYDRFVREQIAGDEIDPDDPNMRIAMMYFRHGPYEFNQRDAVQQWADILNDITDVTGEVFLGLSVGCARCHDHKFDPILQADYYRLQAFFTPLSWRDDMSLNRDDEVRDYHVRRTAWELATADLRTEMAGIEKPYRDEAARGAVDKFPAEIQALLRSDRHRLSPYEQQLRDLAFRQIQFEWDQLDSRIKSQDKVRRDAIKEALRAFDEILPEQPILVASATDIGPDAPPTRIPGRRDAPTVDPGFLSVLDDRPVSVPRPEKARTTGRRSVLADWLTRPDHPLTTRVIVNRIWQYHFGRGLVPTSSDFGRLGESPTHPELLDWLARRFVDDGWSFKSLHRRIVTSATYRQSSVIEPSEAARLTDPDNRYLWRFPSRRLDAEEIRDAILAVTGELERETIGGPSVEASKPRRAVYAKVIRNTRDPFLDAFDAPDNFLSAAQRHMTVTPSQALLLINNESVLDRARAFAERLELSDLKEEPTRVDLAFEIAFARTPSASERTEALDFLERQRRLGAQEAAPDVADPEGPAPEWVDLCHALLNANEFLHVD